MKNRNQHPTSKRGEPNSDSSSPLHTLWAEGHTLSPSDVTSVRSRVRSAAKSSSTPKSRRTTPTASAGTTRSARKKKRPKSPKPPQRSRTELVREFVEKAQWKKHKLYVGIDPGQTGAIGLRCGKVHLAIDIPTTKTIVRRSRRMTFKAWQKKTGLKRKDWKRSKAKYHMIDCTQTDFDLKEICQLFDLLLGNASDFNNPLNVFLEKIPATLGPGRKYAEIMLNRAYAMWPLFLHSKGCRVVEERPGIWKKAMGLLGQDKNYSLARARKIYPNADLRLKKHHDRAEALLMVSYLRKRDRNAS